MVESVNVSVLAYAPVRSASVDAIGCLKFSVTPSLETGRRLFEDQFDQPAALDKWSALVGEFGVSVRSSIPEPEHDLSRLDVQTCPSCAAMSA